MKVGKLVRELGRNVVKKVTTWFRNVKSCVPTLPKPRALPIKFRMFCMSVSRKLIAD